MIRPLRNPIRWCTALLIVATLTVVPETAFGQLGVTAGFNFEQTEDIRMAAEARNKEAVLNNATGYHVGVLWQMGSGAWSLRPAVIFRQMGTYEFSELQENFEVQMIEVPLNIRARLVDAGIFHPYVLAGPKASFPRSEGDFSSATESIAISGNVGGGLGIRAGWLPVSIEAELDYAFGVTDWVKSDFTVGGQTFDPQDQPQLSALSVRVNLLF